MYADPVTPMSIDITSVCGPKVQSSTSMAFSTSMAHTSDKHPRRMMESFNTLRKRQELWDVALVVGSTKLYAHRVVLAAASPYFYVSWLCWK